LKPFAILGRQTWNSSKKPASLFHLTLLEEAGTPYRCLFFYVKFAPTAAVKAERGIIMAPSWQGIVMCAG
jgi:hypothetical protein